MFCVGSGSTLAYSILDDAWDRIDSLNIDEVVELAAWAVRHAAHRDSFSGGFINVLQIDQTGCHHVKRIDSRKMKMR
jgi:20S proteasome subunit beta 5